MSYVINNDMLGLPSGLAFGAPQVPFGDPGLQGYERSAAPAYASMSAYSSMYEFGDSLSDVGNDYKLTLGVLPTGYVYSDGRFSNGNLWVQDLAQQLGLGAVKASLDGGNDYAYGGAETGSETLHSANPLDLPSQFDQFLANGLHSIGNALLTISIGANDVLDAIPQYASNPTAALTDVGQAVANEVQFVKELAYAGGKNFVILNVPDLGKTPTDAGALSGTASKLSALYDSMLKTDLAGLVTQYGLAIHLVDAYTLIDEAVADPAKFGLKNVTTPVWTGNYENPFSGHFNATGAAENKYLFFDHLHPTATGHLAVADAAFASLTTVV